MKRFFAGLLSAQLAVLSMTARSAAVSEQEAASMARKWAAHSRFGVKFSQKNIEVKKFSCESDLSFYSVGFGESGTVFVSGDVRFGKILAFSKGKVGNFTENSPLYALLKKSLLTRRDIYEYAATEIDASVPVASQEGLSDIRVEPFVKTKWAQGNSYASSNVTDSVLCYNRYTPQLDAKYVDSETGDTIQDTTRYVAPAGCVATAMAQAMRYWKAPADRGAFTGREIHPETPQTYKCKYSDSLRQWLLVGSKGYVTNKVERGSFTYDWGQMPLTPLDCRLENGEIVWSGESVTDSQCEAIGALLYDCGVAAGLVYDYDSTGLDSREIFRIPYAITNSFGYAQAILCDNIFDLTARSEIRNRAILPNLDARRPVILLVAGDVGGHAALADGYGYLDGVDSPYVHLNMGWSGQNDVWYNLPMINLEDNPENFIGFSDLCGVVYNITPNESEKGEIVSGRVTDENGQPLANAEVVVLSNDVTVATAVTDDHGIYHFVLPAGVAYEVYTERFPYVALYNVGVLGRSGENGQVGNCGECDLGLALPVARVGERYFPGLSAAMDYAVSKGDKTLEILRECLIGREYVLSTNLTIVATNAVPASSPIKTISSSPIKTIPFITVTDGARLTLSNVVITSHTYGRKTQIEVKSPSSIAVGGCVEVGEILTADAGGFLMKTPLTGAIVLKCEAAQEDGDLFGYSECGDADAAGCIGNWYDLTIGGSLIGNELRWTSDGLVPDSGAFARFVPSGGTEYTNYRSLDILLSAAKGGGDVVILRGCDLSAPASVTADTTFYSDGGYGANVWVTRDGSITVSGGATLTVSNIAIRGSSTGPLFTVGTKVSNERSEGALVLGERTFITDFTNTGKSSGGAAAVKYGSLKLSTGALISNCSASYAGCYGGGVFLATGYASLDLAGGTIEKCFADAYGGGVYASASSTISVSAPSSVRDCECNRSGTRFAQNIYIPKSSVPPVFKLTGDAAGGIIGVTDASRDTAPGVPFLDVETVAQTATNSAPSFICDTASYIGEVSPDASTLVWKYTPVDDQCNPDYAAAYVVWAKTGETNWYDNVDLLLSKIDQDATVYFNGRGEELGSGDTSSTFSRSFEVLHNIVFCSALDGYSVANVGCTNRQVSIYVRPGGTLTLTNVCFVGMRDRGAMIQDDTYGLFAVDGGTLVMEEGSRISYCKGGKSRADGAVNVFNEGVFRMNAGEISAATNRYSATAVDYGVGAGVLVDNATAYFTGGKVTQCLARRYAGVYAGNKSRVYVSGDAVIEGNVNIGKTASNFGVQDLSTLWLDGPFRGNIGVTTGVLADTNIFGRISAPLDAAVIDGATNFVNDVTRARGRVATNEVGEAFLVWATAFPYKVNSFTADSRVYTIVKSGNEQPDPVYFIVFDGGDGVSGSTNPLRCEFERAYKLPKNGFTKSGYKFIGWTYNGRLYEDEVLIFNLSSTNEDEIVFKAAWAAE